MRLEEIKVKKRIKFENLGLLTLILSILLAIASMYLANSGLAQSSTRLAKICLLSFALSWIMITYGQHAKNRKKIIIKVTKAKSVSPISSTHQSY